MAPLVSPGVERGAAWTLSNAWLPPQINLTDACCECSQEPATCALERLPEGRRRLGLQLHTQNVTPTVLTTLT